MQLSTLSEGFSGLTKKETFRGKTVPQLVLRETRADQKTGGALRKFSGRTGMHGKSRVSSAVKYDCFKLDESGNCIIRKTWLHCI